MKKRRVTMFVQNGVTMDNRVLKEARVLRDAGFAVTIVGKRTAPSLLPEEDFEGIRILRVGGDHRLRLSIHDRYERGRKLLLDGYIAQQPDPIKFPPRKLNLIENASTFGQESFNTQLKVRNKARNLRNKVIYKVYNSYWRTIVSRGTKYGFYVPTTKVWAEMYRRTMRMLNETEPITYLIDWDTAVAEIEDRIVADVWHAHDIENMPTAARLRKKYGGKLVYDAHEYWLDCNNVYTRFEKLAWGALEAVMIHQADEVITVSDSIADVLAKRYRVRKPSLVLNTPEYHSVTRSRLLRDKLAIGDDKFVVIYVGLITHKRGYEQLIDALPMIKNGVLVFLGPGDAKYVSGLQRQVEKNGVGDSVHFAGSVGPDDIQNFTCSADVGVVVGQRGAISYECALPSKYFEYVFAGIPVATSDFVEMRRLTKEFDLGTTFDERDPKSIAAALNELQSKKENYTGPGWDRRRMQLARQYAWGEHKKVLLDIYSSLISEGKNANQV